MFKDPKRRKLVMAVIWTAAALSNAVNCYRRLPDPGTLSLMLFVLSAVCCAMWWTNYYKT